MDDINRLLANTASNPPKRALFRQTVSSTPQLILMGCLNFTSGNETLPGRHPYSVQTCVPLTILVGILILLTVFGNFMVVIAVITSRALRAPQNSFLVSLACADILVATLVMPFSLANELMGYWYFGKVWCEIYLALDVLFCTSSIVHLCAISLDRYWSVSQAIEYNLRRTPGRIKCTVFIVWVLAAIISFPPLITMKKDEGKKDRPECKINDEKWYIIFSSTASFFAPCLIMIMVYVRIYQIAKKRTRALPGERQKEYGNPKGTMCGLDALGRKDREGGGMEEGDDREINGLDVEEEPSSSDGNETILCSLKKKRGMRITKVAQVKPGETSPKPEGQPCVRASKWKGKQYRERRFTFVLAVVMGVFVLCWFPFFFTYTLTAVCDTCCVPETLFKMFFWFGYCNSSLNPVIYTIFNNDFRRSFKKILCKRDRRGL
ncbi:alpha-2A adrenergic receptor [Etheostoma spectabile]|uniref:alpha-2A adrenergic receptor n=1 Tax=Etheostoma spectabile TaxID=54343 RepID=UPI0013AF8757|nr:alpha-2A adrenergic receptor-like [Etheostoma spectabile]